MKAGTAQKVVLNVLSTSAMVRTGKSYGAWMVDLHASNQKLRRRARRILTEATGVTEEEARAALEAAGWRTKTALVSILARVDAATADNALSQQRRSRAATPSPSWRGDSDEGVRGRFGDLGRRPATLPWSISVSRTAT